MRRHEPDVFVIGAERLPEDSQLGIEPGPDDWAGREPSEPALERSSPPREQEPEPFPAAPAPSTHGKRRLVAGLAVVLGLGAAASLIVR